MASGVAPESPNIAIADLDPHELDAMLSDLDEMLGDVREDTARDRLLIAKPDQFRPAIDRRATGRRIIAHRATGRRLGGRPGQAGGQYQAFRLQ